jgi:hypothetical protein
MMQSVPVGKSQGTDPGMQERLVSLDGGCSAYPAMRKTDENVARIKERVHGNRHIAMNGLATEM